MPSICGNWVSTNSTFFQSTPFMVSHSRNMTWRNAFKPGTPTFLPMKSEGCLMLESGRTTMPKLLSVFGGLGVAGDGDDIEPAIDCLQQHRRGRHRDIDFAGFQSRRVL